MSFSILNTTVGVYWRHRPLVAREAFDQIIGYLQQLQRLHPIFSTLYVRRHKDRASVLLDDGFANFDTEVALGMSTEWAYKNPDSDDKSFSLECRSPFGFPAYFATTANERQPGCWLDILCGDNNPQLPNYVTIKVSPEIESTELLRAILDQLALVWRPDWGMVMSRTLRAALDQPVGDIRLGEFTYFSDPAVRDDLPAFVQSYDLADGIVVQASKPGVSGKDADDVQAVRLLREALEPRGHLRPPSKRTAAA